MKIYILPLIPASVYILWEEMPQWEKMWERFTGGNVCEGKTGKGRERHQTLVQVWHWEWEGERKESWIVGVSKCSAVLGNFWPGPWGVLKPQLHCRGSRGAGMGMHWCLTVESWAMSRLRKCSLCALMVVDTQGGSRAVSHSAPHRISERLPHPWTPSP